MLTPMCTFVCTLLICHSCVDAFLNVYQNMKKKNLKIKIKNQHIRGYVLYTELVYVRRSV